MHGEVTSPMELNEGVRNNFNLHLLAGLIKCGHCGASMTPRTVGKHRYYVCSNRHKHGKDVCPQPNVPAQKLEQEVINCLNTSINEYLHKRTSYEPDLVFEYKNKMINIESKIKEAKENTLKLIKKSDELSDEQFKYVNDKLKEELEYWISEKEEMSKFAPNEVEKLQSKMNEWPKVDQGNLELIREYISDFISEIKIKDTDIDIDFTFKV